jgi:hypothetical protein
VAILSGHQQTTLDKRETKIFSNLLRQLLLSAKCYMTSLNKRALGSIEIAGMLTVQTMLSISG